MTDQPIRIPDPGARASAAIDRLAAADHWLDCTDPPMASCADAACPVHGDERIGRWVECEICWTWGLPGGPCSMCGADL